MNVDHIHVLLIEDEACQVRLFREMLRDSDIITKIDSVARISEAATILRDAAVDLVVLDLNLPDSNGLNTLRAVREMAPDIPVLVMTGSDAHQLGAEAVELGADDFLVKGRPSGNSLARCMRFAVLRKRARKAEADRRNLQSAVEALRQMLGVVGHELRTPLAAMRLTADHLLNDTEGIDMGHRAMLHAIHDESIRMAETLNNLLEAARLNSGAANWRWSVVSLGSACINAADLVSNLIDVEQVELNVQIDPQELQMKGDPDAIRRLVINLLTNAAKHTQSGRIDLIVKQAHQVDGRWIKLVVQDTGEGMTQDIVEKLGKPFLLNSGVVGADYVKGTGLGLSICRGIAAAHGGSISVRSAQGKGSVFTVMLRADLDHPMPLDCKSDEKFTVEVAA